MKSRSSGSTTLLEQDSEECFRRALEVARGQNARSLQLRAATSLGRLLHQQGKLAEARGAFDALYASFDEGFATTDLQRAESLRAKLSG